MRWLRSGWSSHFERFDAAGRRRRCDFVSRPPRISPSAIQAMFQKSAGEDLLVVDREALIRLIQMIRQFVSSENQYWTTLVR